MSFLNVLTVVNNQFTRVGLNTNRATWYREIQAFPWTALHRRILIPSSIFRLVCCSEMGIVDMELATWKLPILPFWIFSLQGTTSSLQDTGNAMGR